MTAFLASLEGGLIEEANLESKTSDAQERARTASLTAKVSNLLTSFLDVEAKGELSKKVLETLESNYKSTVRFPSAALFIRLRELLLDQSMITWVDSNERLDGVAVGDLIEFSGLVVGNPTYQIRRAFNQMLPLLEPIYNLKVTQIDQSIALLKDAKPGQTVKIGNEDITFENTQQIKVTKALLEGNRKQAVDESSVYQSMGQVITGLFPEDRLDTLVFRAEGFQAIAKVYPVLSRDERIQDIHDATWQCLGKVIGFVSESDSYDLLKGSPVSYFIKDQFPALANMFNNENLNIQTTEPQIKGPAVVVAPLAIFA